MKFTLILLSILFSSQMQAFTLPQQSVKSYECDVCNQLSRERLQDKWEITNHSLKETPTNLQKSYGYREKVSLEQLRQGIAITSTAPGAVIRINPLKNALVPQLMIKTPDHQLFNLKDASFLYSQDETFGDQLISTKQTMLQIKPELGFGTFILKSDEPSLANADNAYLINVFDKFSPTFLEVKTDSLHYQYGDKVIATIHLAGNDNYDIDTIEVSLVSPKAQSIPLKITRIKNNQYKATAILDSELNDRGENWYIEANVQTLREQELIKRTGHTAFSYSVPSASLLHIKQLSSKPLTFVATLEVATASRYALQSVLYRKNGNGPGRPIETSQRAQWLEPGKQVIQFTFDNSRQLSEDTLYLGYLRLIDYGQLKPVYQYTQPIKLTLLAE